MTSILILEDDIVFGALLSDALELSGYSVDHFSEYDAAVEALNTNQYDAIITDLILRQGAQISPKGGVSFTWQTKKYCEQFCKTIPVIAMSGISEKSGLDTALDVASDVGADFTLKKPFSPNELEDALMKLIPVSAA